MDFPSGDAEDVQDRLKRMRGDIPRIRINVFDTDPRKGRGE
jgi:hypothetical protein